MNSTIHLIIKKQIQIFVILLSSICFSQVTYTANPTNNAINTSLTGSNINISGGTLNSGVRATQIATFSNGISAGLEMNKGVFFGTGTVSKLLSVNNNLQSTDNMNITYNDSNLLTVDNNANKDVVSYSFSVTLGPKASTLSINYQFGSEEYPNYVGSVYNDAFGFFISGPGITGTENLAKLPNGNPTSINKVNYGVPGYNSTNASSYDGTQSSLYINNGHTTTQSGGKLNNNTNPGPFPVAVQFNGITKMITYSVSNLVPGGTYTFKIVIADSSDSTLDSGVFVNFIYATQTLVANNDSFLTSPGNITSSVLNNDTVNGTSPASLSDISLSQISTTNSGVTLNSSTGEINVAAGTLPGIYTVTYQICDLTYPSNCKTAEAVVNVQATFACNTDIYMSYDNGGDTPLYKVNTSVISNLVYDQLGAPTSGLRYNAIGFNPNDGFIYGIKVGSNNNNLVRINNLGQSQNLGPVVGLPTNGSSNYIAGEIDNNSNYYVKIGAFNAVMYKITIDPAGSTATPINLNFPSGVTGMSSPDFSYSTTTQLLYGVGSFTTSTSTIHGQFYSIDPTNGNVTFIGSPTSPSDFGGMIGAAGEIYGFSNAGGFYKFNLTTGGRTLISNSPSATNNDAAHCVTSPLVVFPDVCFRDPITTGTAQETKVGITLLKRAGTGNSDNWPMVRKGGHIALESNTQGFVISRIAKADLGNISQPQEGMMVYDTTDKCLKIYDGTAWKCFNAPSCP